MPSDFGTQSGRELEMTVRVFKKDGRQLAVVAECELEQYGWGTSPLGALERWRAEQTCRAREDGREPWDDVLIEVRRDEDCGYPIRHYQFTATIGVEATRDQQALRAIGMYLIDLANGKDEKPQGFTGRLELGIVGEG